MHASPPRHGHKGRRGFTAEISMMASTRLGLWRPGHEEDCSVEDASDRMPQFAPRDGLQQDKTGEQIKQPSDSTSKGHFDHEVRPLKLPSFPGAKPMMRGLRYPFSH